jgi:hypothetical protein
MGHVDTPAHNGVRLKVLSRLPFIAMKSAAPVQVF